MNENFLRLLSADVAILILVATSSVLIIAGLKVIEDLLRQVLAILQKSGSMP